jgi:putative DNA-invertase from lambdoid prophage Rac
MIAAVYLRVSTDRQDEANQEPECLRLCTARGWEPRIFRETESGAKRRPQWDRVKEAARRGEVGAVVFWALDRAGRNRVQLAHDLGELWRWGMQIASVRDAWVDQPAGPLRDLLVQLMGWFAQTERDVLRERTRAGIARARANGVTLGRPSAMPLEARAFALAHGDGRTPGEVRRLLKSRGFGDFARRTVQRAMGPDVDRLAEMAHAEWRAGK